MPKNGNTHQYGDSYNNQRISTGLGVLVDMGIENVLRG